jgi:hypothetical protein
MAIFELLGETRCPPIPYVRGEENCDADVRADWMRYSPIALNTGACDAALPTITEGDEQLDWQSFGYGKMEDTFGRVLDRGIRARNEQHSWLVCSWLDAAALLTKRYFLDKYHSESCVTAVGPKYTGTPRARNTQAAPHCQTDTVAATYNHSTKNLAAAQTQAPSGLSPPLLLPCSRSLKVSNRQVHR